MEYRNLTENEILGFKSRILFEDNHLLIVNKLSGEIVQGDKTGDECLAEALKAYIAQRDKKAGKVFLGVTHRLDRPVSGACIFAKTSKALERMNALFRDGEVHKFYWALCQGKPTTENALLENYLNRNEKQNKSYVCKQNSEGAKLARLRYKVLAEGLNYSLLEVELLSGRHHQIRCQLSHIGCPIKGDLKYGAPRSNRDGGICLHSRRISFIHPVKKENLEITAPILSAWGKIVCELTQNECREDNP